MLLTAWALVLYARWITTPKCNASILGWTVPLLVLSHVHLLSAGYLLCGISAHFLLTRPRPRAILAFALAVGLVCAAVIPWLIFTNASQWFVISGSEPTPLNSSRLIPLFVNVFEPILLPLIIIGVVALMVARFEIVSLAAAPVIQVAFIIVLITLLLHSVQSVMSISWPWTRYISILFPCYAVLASTGIVAIAQKSIPLAGAIVIVCHFTTAPAHVMGKFIRRNSPIYSESINYLGCPQFKFYSELTQQYRGPLDGVIDEITKHSTPSDTLFIEFEAEPIIWYTGLRVVRELPFNESPDWIITRDNLGTGLQFVLSKGHSRLLDDRLNMPSWKVNPEDLQRFRMSNLYYVRRYLKRSRYFRVITDSPSLWIQDYPELANHIFSNSDVPDNFPRQQVFRLVQGSGQKKTEGERRP